MAKAILRCDGGLDVGLGHVMRCRALAAAFKARGWHCWFAMTPETAALAGEPEPILVPGGTDGAPAVAAAIAAREVDCLVVDDYRLDAAFELAARGSASVVLVIDDLANRRHDCEMIVDSNPGRTVADYVRLSRAGTQFLVGPDHILLRPEFLARRPSQVKPSPIRPRRFLITLGGADPQNFSGRVLAALRHSERVAEQTLLVIGPANSFRDRLVAEAADVGADWVVDPPDLPALMAEADIAATAAGVTCWELICLSVPLVVLLTAENQRAVAGAVHEAGVVLDESESRDPARIARALSNLAADPELRGRMAIRARELVDGRGAERVAAAVERLVAARQEKSR